MVYPNAIYFIPPQFCPSLSLLSCPVFSLSSSIVLSRYFVISVNSMTTWSMLKLPKIAWPSPLKLAQFPSFPFKLVSSRFYSRRLFIINQRKKIPFFATDPKFTCLNKGLFLCINCCGVHTSFNNESGSARIKSIEIGDWTEAMLGVSKQQYTTI